jgi:hypothetical protein
MGDASAFTTTLRSIAIGRGVIGTAGKPHNVSAAAQLGSSRFQRNSNAIPPLNLPITSVIFSRKSIEIGESTDGNFLTGRSDNPTSLVPGENYGLFRVIVEANKTYNFDLTSDQGPPPADADLVVSRINTAFTSNDLRSIGNWNYGDGDLPNSVLDDSTSGGALDNIEIVTTSAGFFDIVIISYEKGDWSLIVRENI